MTESPERIERQIEETRRSIGRTIDAIKVRTSKSAMIDQAIGMLKESGGEMAQNTVSTVTRNPLPMGLIFSGLAWLMLSQTFASRDGHASATDGHAAGNGVAPGYDADLGYDLEAVDDEPDRNSVSLYVKARDSVEGLQRASDETADAFSRRYYEARARALGIERQATEQYDDFKRRVDSAYHEAADRARMIGAKLAGTASAAAAGVRDAMGGATHALQGAASATSAGAAQGASRLGGAATHLFEEQPLVAGAIGVAIGAFMGAAFPTTETEGEAMGAAAQQMRASATRGLKEAAESAADVKDSVISAGSDAARKEGLSTDNAKRAIHDAGKAAEHVIDASKRKAAERLKATDGQDQA
jgi:hypothetical protein